MTCSIDDTSLVSHIEANRMLHSTESATTETLKNAMKGDMKCYNDMQSLLLELDEHMCGVEAKHIKYIRNKGCWNGTHSKGKLVKLWTLLYYLLTHNCTNTLQFNMCNLAASRVVLSSYLAIMLCHVH